MKRILALVLISISLVSCQRREKINNLIKSIQTFPVTADQDIVSGADVPTEETIDGVKYKCFSTPKTLSQSLLDIVAFNPNTGKLYPGALIKGASLKDGILNDIPVKRNGGQLTISYINFKDSTVKYSEPIVEANFQNFQEAFKKLTNRLPDGNQVARLVFEKTESHELEESFLRLGISAKWLSASVKGRLEQSFQSNQSKYFVKVVQPYFDISFQTNYEKNQEPADFFSNKVSIDNVMEGLGDTTNSPPAFIKSVVYGRMLLLFIESDATQQDLTTALETTFSGATASGQLNLSTGQRSAIENSKINILSLGGSAEATIKLLTGNKLDSLVDYLKAGANFSKNSPAFPISYTSQYLKTNDVAKLSYATNYSVKKCIKNPKKIVRFEIGFLGIDDDKDDDEPINFIVRKGDIVVGQNMGVGAGQTWEEGRDIYVQIPITEEIFETDRSVLSLDIDKSNAHGGGDGQGGGFRFARHLVNVYYENGSKENWYDYNQRLRLGNGDPKNRKIKF